MATLNVLNANRYFFVDKEIVWFETGIFDLDLFEKFNSNRKKLTD